MMILSRQFIPLIVCLRLSKYVASQGNLEESMAKILLEQVATAKEKYVTYPVDFVFYQNDHEGRKRIISGLSEGGKIHQGGLNASAPIKILIHGWHHGLKTTFEHDFFKAFNGTIRYVQVISVRWKEAERDYIGARRAVPGVARQVYAYIQRLGRDYGVKPEQLGFFGHGLGAQICGAVGHLSGGQIGKIIALDPAMPLFWQNTHDSVNKSSAMKVIGVHTSAGTFGVIWNVGHADFWSMHGMAPQQPCLQKKTPEEQLRCSHEAAADYFLETLKFNESIKAETCGKKYVCHPQVFKKEKVKLTEYVKVAGQFCFVPPEWHPWPVLKEILEERNATDLPTSTETPLQSQEFTLPPGVTLPSRVDYVPGGTLPPGVTLPPGITMPPAITLPPGALLPPGVDYVPGGTLPPGVTLPPGITIPPAVTSKDFTTPGLPLDDCDEMIRLHKTLFRGSRRLGVGTKTGVLRQVKNRALRARIKKCEDLRTRMRRISRASLRRV